MQEGLLQAAVAFTTTAATLAKPAAAEPAVAVAAAPFTVAAATLAKPAAAEPSVAVAAATLAKSAESGLKSKKNPRPANLGMVGSADTCQPAAAAADGR